MKSSRTPGKLLEDTLDWTLKEQHEHLASSMPSVGNSVAKPSSAYFGFAERVFGASEEELKEVDLVEPKTAEKIWGWRARGKLGLVYVS